MPELRAFACGSTSHRLSMLLRGAPSQARRYPAGVFVYDGGGRRILFDTGYAPRPWKTGLRGALYQRLLPPKVDGREVIARQIDPATVSHVVVSHLHPDHIGGMLYFEHATFIMSRACVNALDHARVRDGVLHGLIPDWFDPARAIIVDEFTPGPHGIGQADVLGDPGFVLLDLPGHSPGHIGALVAGRVVLAADASWGRDMLGQEDRVRAIPRSITHDYDAVKATAQALLRAEAAGLRLLFSHDQHPTGVDLL
ncbi:MAG: MBL fold metallo-hydrolase [Arachnia sp.]